VIRGVPVRHVEQRLDPDRDVVDPGVDVAESREARRHRRDGEVVGSTSSSSAHVTGVDTRPSGVARTE
jgi:hypothetical protein